MATVRILVVDDSMDTLEIVRRHLERAGYEVLTATSVPEAYEHLRESMIQLIITDLKMPGQSGLELVRWVRENLPEAEVMMITGYASVEGAVEAVKCGAGEYLAKPFTDKELLTTVSRALETRRRRLAAAAAPAETDALPGLVGDSPPMRRLYRDILKAARSDATVLILGESGTGKELVARAVHYRSRRSAAPFVPINCGAIPETLLESELFGHVRGAFTGAEAARAGFFQTADRGTVFLDEVGELSLAGQVRLLRVLQDGEVCMVGSNRPRLVDVRVVAATNKDLSRLIEQHRFREDLYYRLNVVVLEVPPLRDRGEDVLLLAGHFAHRFAEEQGRKPPRFSDRVVARLLEYDWPGNVRELENLVQRLVVMCEDDTLDVADLPRWLRTPVTESVRSVLRPLADVERAHIRAVLRAVGGNRTRAAEVLGIDRKTLRRKLTDGSEQPRG